jgi:hypothetical protein
LAEALRKEPDVEVQLVDGKHGELTVEVDDKVVARKWLFVKPSLERALAAVRQTTPTQPSS